jgi:hypothetical protein
MKKLIVEIKGKKYSLQEGYTIDLGKYSYQFENPSDANDAINLYKNRTVLSDIDKLLDKAGIRYKKIGHAMPSVFSENITSAKRTIRRVLKQVIDEYKRNIKNPELHDALEKIIVDLQTGYREIQRIEEFPDKNDRQYNRDYERDEAETEARFATSADDE